MNCEMETLRLRMIRQTEAFLERCLDERVRLPDLKQRAFECSESNRTLSSRGTPRDLGVCWRPRSLAEYRSG